MNDQKEFEEVIELRPLTKEMVASLANGIGSVGMPIVMELGNIDYDAGQGVLKNKDSNDRCIWLKSGHRISVYIGVSNIVSKSNNPDHTYFEILSKAAGFLQTDKETR